MKQGLFREGAGQVAAAFIQQMSREGSLLACAVGGNSGSSSAAPAACGNAAALLVVCQLNHTCS